jgi:aryl-alcohol dehydrogenase-like predicted oxidoreductase
MKTRSLGHGLNVSAIGIGCMTMTSGGNIRYGEAATIDGATATVHRAIDMGVTFFDTAEIYGPFDNEVFLGEAIRAKGSSVRDALVIATKFAFRYNDREVTGVDGSPANVRRAVEGSLTRLGVDHIDLYYQHRVDPAVAIEETVGAMAELISEGKIKHIGLSEAGPETLRRAAAVAPISALQSEYSLWERDVEADILPTCRALGIGFVPYSPLGRGFLTGQIKSFDDLPADDWRRNDPRLGGENFAANLAIVDVVKAVGERHRASAAQVALAWLLAQGDDIVPIPGVKRLTTMADSVGAANLTLTAADLAELEAAAPHGATAGDRYGPAGMRMVRL